jgi:4-oxalocrotonate tautomerase family enzyme
MPVAQINLLKGHSPEALRQILVEVSSVMSRILGAPKDRLIVRIVEADPALWAIGGVPASEALVSGKREELEIPFVQMVLMEGRPKEQFHALIEAITEIVARGTGIHRERIRMHIALAHPDNWGIGGVPASVARAKELAERARGQA